MGRSTSNNVTLDLDGTCAALYRVACLGFRPAHAADTLRQKIEADASDPRIIITEPGIGYRIADTSDQ